MTKGAINIMSQTLANALGARGISVNAVAPGPTDTDMTAFLASDDARWITGELLDVTGGMWLGATHVSAASPAPYQGEDSQHRTALPADMEARDAAPTDSTARG
jgi:short-subunit dehydrogenase